MTLYGDTASGEVARLRQALADARAQSTHDARRARVAEARLEAVRDVLDQADDTVVTQADGEHVPVYLIRRALDGTVTPDPQ